MKNLKRDVPVVVHSGDVPESMEYVDGFINKGESVSSFLALIRSFIKRYCESAVTGVGRLSTRVLTHTDPKQALTTYLQ